MAKIKDNLPVNALNDDVIGGAAFEELCGLFNVSKLLISDPIDIGPADQSVYKLTLKELLNDKDAEALCYLFDSESGRNCIVLFRLKYHLLFSSCDYKEDLPNSFQMAGGIGTSNLRKGLQATNQLLSSFSESSYENTVFPTLLSSKYVANHSVDLLTEKQLFKLAFETETELKIGSASLFFSLRFNQVYYELPYADIDSSSSTFSLEGTVAINETGLQFIATYELIHDVLLLSFKGFPTLKDLLEHCGVDFSDDLPSPLDSFLSVTLTELLFSIDPIEKRLNGILLKATLEKPIEILPKILEFTPSLTLQVTEPFSAQDRYLSGVFTGHWAIGDAKLETSISYPNYDIYAGLPEGSTLDLDIKALVGDDLPQGLPTDLKFTQLSLAGNLRQKAFTFTLATEMEWELLEDKLAINKIELLVGMTPAEPQWQKDFYVSAELEISERVHLYLSGEYHSGQGFHFRGSTGQGEEIKVGQALDDLVKKLGAGEQHLPEAVRNSTLRNLSVEFDTNGNFTFSLLTSTTIEGRTVDLYVKLQREGADGDWKIVGSLYLGIGLELGVVFAQNTAEPAGGEDAESSVKDAIAVGTLVFDPARQYDIKQLIGLFAPQMAGRIPFNVGMRIDGMLMAVEIPGDTKGKEGKEDQQVEKADKSYLFRLRFGLQFDLGGFPLIGQWLKDIQFRDAQLLLTKPAWTPASLNALNSALSDLPHPPPDVKRLAQGDQTDVGLPAGIGIGGTFHLSDKLEFPLYQEFGTDKPQKQLPEGEKDPAEVGTPTEATDEDTPTPGKGPSVDRSPAEEPSTENAASPASAADRRSRSKINQLVGAVRIRQVSMIFEGGRLGLKLTGGLSMAAFEFELMGLQVTVPQAVFHDVSKIKEIDFGLDGFAADIQKGKLTIKGAFLRTIYEDSTGQHDMYNGLVQVSFPPFALAGMGSYTNYNGHPSLFAFVALGFPLAVTPAILIQGLSGGFGMHRDFKKPALKEITSFPLVAMSTTPPPKIEIADLVSQMNTYFPPTPGQFFVVAGIKFRVFGLVDNQLLLIAKFGRELEMTLMGISSIAVPGAYLIELAWEATVRPDRGEFSLMGGITSRSFLLLESVRITGDFAAKLWTKDGTFHEDVNGQEVSYTAKAGDFVVSVGGYHPAYKIPRHYPQRLERLGVKFDLGPLSVRAGLYFAITPKCLMMGGELNAHAEDSGTLYSFAVDLDMYIHALIYFDPFSYDLTAGFSASVSLTLGGGPLEETFNEHLDVEAHIWGPSLSGKLRIEFHGYEFPYSFGDSAGPSSAPISAATFRDKYLAGGDFCSVQVAKGLIREVDKEGKKIHIVDADELVVEVKSLVPLIDGAGEEFGIVPLDIKGGDFDSALIVNGDYKGFAAEEIMDNVPRAIWGPDGLTGEIKVGDTTSVGYRQPDLNDDRPALIEAVVGKRFTPKPSDPPESSAELDSKPLFASNDPGTCKDQVDTRSGPKKEAGTAASLKLRSAGFTEFTGLNDSSQEEEFSDLLATPSYLKWD